MSVVINIGKSVFAVMGVLSFFTISYSYQPKEMFFTQLNVLHEVRNDNTNSCVLIIKGKKQFHQKVIRDSGPVVVEIFSEDNEICKNFRSIYQNVAETFKDKVLFTSMNAVDNESIIRAIMLKLRIVEMALPVLLFFKDGLLILPIVSGIVDKENLLNIVKNHFDVKKDVKKTETDELTKKEKKTDDEQSVWEKIEDIKEKIKKWIWGMQDVAKEVNSYQSSKRWKQKHNFS